MGEDVFPSKKTLIEELFRYSYNEVSGMCDGDEYQRVLHNATVTDWTYSANVSTSSYTWTNWVSIISCIDCSDTDPLFDESPSSTGDSSPQSSSGMASNESIVSTRTAADTAKKKKK